MVVVLDHCRHVISRHPVVIQELARLKALALQLALHLRVLTFKLVLVFQIGPEQMAGVLDVGDPRFPEQVEQIHAVDPDITQTVQLVLIPGDPVHRRPRLQLLPQVI